LHARTAGRLLSLVLCLAVLPACGGGDTCGTGTVDCGGTCVDTTRHLLNCGACGNACGAMYTCTAGACVADCPAGQILCGGACVDPQVDASHCGASGSCSSASAGTACVAGTACTAGSCVSLCTRGPLDLATPFPTGLPGWMGTVAGQQSPTAFWGTIPAPRPTNTAWQQMVVNSGQGRADFLPYQVKAVTEGLAIANAAPVATATDVTVPDLKQLVLGAWPGSFTGHVVTAHDLFSVTFRYDLAGGGTMTAPLVQGSPYVTAIYAGIKPHLLPGADATRTRTFTLVTGDVSSSGTQATGTRFQVGLSDGTSWLIYTSASVTFTWAAGDMFATAPLSGTLRLAHVPSPAAVAVLDAHAGAIPTGGTLDATLDCDVATLHFNFTTTGSGPLLMAAMPHHLKRLVVPSASTALAFNTLSGTLVGVEGSSWTMSLPLPATSWSAPRAPAPAHLAELRAALAIDAGYVPDAGAVASDPYFGGKYLAKLARLALIADDLGEAATAITLRERLRPLVAAWLEGSNANKLVYDATWGGVVTTASLASPGAYFGSGHYNDHHFHYGYHLYAAAALAKVDPDFYASHRAALLALVRDIANPSAADPDFPRFRHMDFFRGHSWASGLSEYPDIPDQESTSEAVNAWYGLRLLGQAAGDTRMSDLGRLLLALEIDAAQVYWQIPVTSTIYPASFAQNRCVGRLFATRADFGTWFGAEPFKVYGIQLLPFTPVSEALVSPAWVADAWPVMQPAADAATGVWAGWKGLLYMAHATTDREAAWTTVTSLTAIEDGNSYTNTLWWVATRP
jgi:endo-1,3(4)-beta-glucanase